ncbi:hypothetical protein HYX19_00475, partial [Candidatus Woesearchaeota archaeon]|nr:hypothetical protein [Candidatus Woesearchaeota archaeon]
MNIPRRKFLGEGLGIISILAMPQIAGSQEMYGLKEFREYAVSIYKEAKKYSEKGVV